MLNFDLYDFFLDVCELLVVQHRLDFVRLVDDESSYKFSSGREAFKCKYIHFLVGSAWQTFLSMLGRSSINTEFLRDWYRLRPH